MSDSIDDSTSFLVVRRVGSEKYIVRGVVYGDGGAELREPKSLTELLVFVC